MSISFGLRASARAIVGAALVAGFTASAGAENFTIASSLPRAHLWVSAHKDLFIEKMQEKTEGEITFTPFYAGEITGLGRELDALQNGVVDIVDPVVAPYHEGAFPLSEVTQLPTYETDAIMVTRAFQSMMDSDVEIINGKTFYDYEVGDKDIKAWGIGATAAYSISTTGKELTAPGDFEGVPMRAGSALQTIVLEKLGATPVTMPASQAYEAMSRGTIDGIVLAVVDWKSYSMEQLLRYTIEGVAIGQWESYLAITPDAWGRMSPEQQAIFDETAREVSIAAAERWESGMQAVRDEAVAAGAKFVSIDDLSEEMQAHIAKAAQDSWVDWIERLEGQGHPAKAAAKLYAEAIIAEGGVLPAGIDDYLGL